MPASESPAPSGSPVTSVPAATAAASDAPLLVVRVTSAADVPCLAAIPAGRIVWVETTMDLAEGIALQGLPLDVLLSDPASQASSLYRLARQRTAAPIRVTIPALPGLGRAGSGAIALRFPVRLLPDRPSAEALAEMELLLDRYLHDANAGAPVEFFHTALARLLHGAPGTLWEVLERDPAWFPRVASEGEAPGAHPPADNRFVAGHLARLDEAGAECATCPVHDWCAGYFKWPDPTYSCDGVRRLMDAFAAAVSALRRDLAEVERLGS